MKEDMERYLEQYLMNRMAGHVNNREGVEELKAHLRTALNTFAPLSEVTDSVDIDTALVELVVESEEGFEEARQQYEPS
jgi:hypothetical protein